MRFECLNPAYNKIKNSGIYNKILIKEEALHEMLLYHSPYIKDSDNIFEKAREFYFDENRGISERSKVFEDIIKLERDVEDEDYFAPNNFEEVLAKHPCFLGYFILGDEMFHYKKFKFSGLKSLSESITSFCVGERCFSDDYVWRSNNIKNKISQNIHGDLYASQGNVFGESFLEKTLFGNEEVFDICTNVQYSAISAYQDWSQFLVASLKYAECLKKEKMKEIVNWKKVLEDAGWGVGTNTAEAFGTNFSEYDLEFLMDSPVLQDGIKLEQFPLHIYSQSKISSYPYFSKGKLFYLIENETGDIAMENLSHIYKSKNFSKVLEYSEEDLPHILTATYKYFARDRSIMHKIMNYFNSKHE